MTGTPGSARTLTPFLAIPRARRARRRPARDRRRRAAARPSHPARAASPARSTEAVGPAHDGVAQKALDVFADDAFVKRPQRAQACAPSSPRSVTSRSRLDADGAFLVAIDPLDGSSNIEANIIHRHALLRARRAGRRESPPRISCSPASTARRRFRALRAAGRLRLHDRRRSSHGDSRPGLQRVPNDRHRPRASPQGPNEFAINASNSRYWPAPVRAYIEDCLEGDEGPRGRNFNMRWVGSVVADVYRILIRGGVYLYPRGFARGLRTGPLAPALRGQPDRASHRTGGRSGDRRLPSHPRRRAAVPAHENAADLRLEGQGRAHRPVLWRRQPSRSRRPSSRRRGLLRR